MQEVLHSGAGRLVSVESVDHDGAGAGILLEQLRSHRQLAASQGGIAVSEGSGDLDHGADGVLLFLIDLGPGNEIRLSAAPAGV